MVCHSMSAYTHSRAENKSRESHIIEGQLNAASANAIVTLHAGYCHSLFSTELQAFNTSSHTHFTSFIEN